MEKKHKDKKWSYPKRSPLQDLNAKSTNLSSSSSSSSSRTPKVSSTRLRSKSSTNENHLPRPTTLKLKNNYPKKPTSRKSNLSKNLKQKEEANGSAQLLDCTPLGKLASSSSGIDSATSHHNSNTASNTTKTPPIEVSVSPEIQSGLSAGLISAATPCYAAGHVLSGVTDKRKCRPRGVLTIGTLIDSSDCEGVGRNEVYKKSSRGSLVPLPAMASMHWLLSPSRESNDFCEGDSVDEFRILNGSAMSELPYSASTFSGSTSDLSCADSSLLMSHPCRILQKCTNFGESERYPLTFSKSPSNIASDSVHNRAKYCDSVNRDAARIGGKPRIVQSPGLKDPSSDEMGRNLFPSSPLGGISCCHDVKVPDEWKCSCSLVRENSPCSTVSLSSGNVIQTPKSDTSSAKCGGFSWLHSDDHDGDNLGAELDSVADFLHQTSLSPRAQPSAFDPPNLHFKFTDASWVSDSTFDNVSQSQMRISWRDGIVSRIFESDDLDCCRCLSDDENGGYCGVKFSSPLEENDLLPETGSQSPELLEQKHELSRNGKLKSPLPEANSCAESILTEGGGLVSSADSDWTHSYKNQLYQI